jgi:hypothetical protein
MVNWTTIISCFGGSIAFFGAAAWLAKSLVTHLLRKDVESFKAQLQFDKNLMMDKFRADLEKASLEHRVRFSKLHEKRAEVIAELYSLIVVANQEIEDCIAMFDDERRSSNLAKSATEQVDVLDQYVKLHQIYFTKSLATELAELCASLDGAAYSFKAYCESRAYLGRVTSGEECSPRLDREDTEGLLSEAKIDADAALRITEAEFRELLGVEPNTDENSKPR